jgi:hypothetical protein
VQRQDRARPACRQRRGGERLRPVRQLDRPHDLIRRRLDPNDRPRAFGGHPDGIRIEIDVGWALADLDRRSQAQLLGRNVADYMAANYFQPVGG